MVNRFLEFEGRLQAEEQLLRIQAARFPYMKQEAQSGILGTLQRKIAGRIRPSRQALQAAAGAVGIQVIRRTS